MIECECGASLNSMDKTLCEKCLADNHIDEEAFDAVWDDMEILRTENKMLKKAIKTGLLTLSAIAAWREAAHEHDDDIGSTLRIFNDKEDWDNLEKYAKESGIKIEEIIKDLKDDT